MTIIIRDRLRGTRSSLASKAPCRVATTAAITLAGQQTIDGVTVVDNDRVLVKNQTNAAENGIYVVNQITGQAWARAGDWDSDSDVTQGTRVYVQSGNTGAGEYYVSTAAPIYVGTTAVTIEAYAADAADVVTLTGTQTLTNKTFADVVSIQISDANVQDDVYDKTKALRLESELDIAGTAVADSASEFGQSTQVVINATSSQVSYEKGAAFFVAQTNDPSDYGSGITRDAVGLDTRGYIGPSNPTGRAWGGYSESKIISGGTGDGLLIGHEVLVRNEGTDQTNINTTTSKYGLFIVSGGSVPLTAAMYILPQPGTAGFHNGILIASNALEASDDIAIGVTDSDWEITRDGAAKFASVAVGDSSHSLGLLTGVDPIWNVDTNDSLRYDRSENTWIYNVASTDVIAISSIAVRPAVDDGASLGTNAEKFSNLYLNGDITVGGTVDGRDVAADGGKLDTIESGADVTDATNVTAAGALMDSELADITAIKTLQAPDNTTISTFAATVLDDTTALAARTTLEAQAGWVAHANNTTDTSTGATAYDWGSIPSWVTEIKILIGGLSCNSSATMLILIGDAGGVENTGYIGRVRGNTAGTSSSKGFPFTRSGTFAAGDLAYGQMILNYMGTRTWTYSSNVVGNANLYVGGGIKTLSEEPLDRIQLTTEAGTPTFDAGQVRVYYR